MSGRTSSTSGFTLIETLVVLSITALLSTVLILYSHIGENQIALFRDQSQVIGIIAKAKSLALQTYVSGGAACGYGVHFTLPNTVILFKDQAANCANSDNVYSGPSEEFSHLILDQNITFASTDMTDILFVPPDPTVIMTPAITSGTITLQAAGSTAQVKIKVNSAGQISTN